MPVPGFFLGWRAALTEVSDIGIEFVPNLTGVVGRVLGSCIPNLTEDFGRVFTE